MMNQICPEAHSIDSSRFAVLYKLATGTIDLQTAQALLPGGARRCCESQWGFEYGGDARRCEESLYSSCDTEHPKVILTMREEPWDVIGLTRNPKMPVAIDDLEEFLDVSDPMFDTSPVTRVAHYLWGRGRTQSEVQCTDYFLEIWRICMANIFGTPECGFVDLNSSKNEVVS
jgi:hypothetical protein